MTCEADKSTINRRHLLVLATTFVTSTFTGSSALANPHAQERNLNEGNNDISNKVKSFVKLVALYRKPVDIDSFERHYKEVHIPLVLKTPHLKEFRVTHYTASPTWAEPEFYLMAEEIYASQADLDQARNSPELRASTKDMEALSGETQTVVINMTAQESQWSY